MSQVGICNKALTALGANTIISLDEDTNEAKLCKEHYQLALDFLLESASWTFATVRKKLPASAEDAPEPFTKKFLIPNDIIRVLEASENPDFNVENPTNWQIEGSYIVSDSQQIYIRGITNSITTNAFTPAFEKALVAYLAGSIALAITQSSSTEQAKLREASQLLQLAVSLDSVKGRTRKLRSNKYISVRRGYGSYFTTNP